MGLSRGEFLSRVGMLREIEPLTAQAYKFAETLEAEAPRAPHGEPWHVSFHGSMFPGDDAKACARRAIYTMMDLPGGGFSRSSRMVMDAGKGIENELVRRWHAAGYLLSAPPDAPQQTKFIDAEHWLTCTVDAIVARPRHHRPIVAEVKSKYAKEIEAMKRLLRGPDEAHVRQIKCEIGLAHDYGQWYVQRCINSGRLAVYLGEHNGDRRFICPAHGGDKCLENWMLEPVEHGFLYYVSRDNPMDTFEYYFEYDAEFMRKGREQLALWRRYWEEGFLPQTDFKGKNPMGWNWTTEDSPCRWCPYGSNRGSGVCREDHQTAVKSGELLPIHDSLAVEEAREVRPEYDLDLVRAAVAARWGNDRLDS